MENQRASVGRPAHIAYACHDFFRLTAVCGDKIHFPGLARLDPLESDPLAIRRPACLIGSYRRKRELQPFASIHFTSPKVSLGDTCVGYPLSVFGEGRTVHR